MYVYVIADGEYVKIGVADDIRRRLSGLQMGNPRPLVLRYLIPAFDRSEAFLIEWKLHQALSHAYIRGEWFVADVNVVQDLYPAGELHNLSYFGQPQNQATQKAVDWLKANPDKADWSSRDLAKLIGVSHVTVNEAKKLA